MTAPTPQEISDAPKIKIGGKEWPIPKLVARQNKIIDPIVFRLVPMMAEIRAGGIDGLKNVDEKTYDNFHTICHAAITRASPDFTREQFLDMPVTIIECIEAFETIAIQTGVFKKGGDAQAGEAQAVSPPIGIAS